MKRPGAPSQLSSGPCFRGQDSQPPRATGCWYSRCLVAAHGKQKECTQTAQCPPVMFQAAGSVVLELVCAPQAFPMCRCPKLMRIQFPLRRTNSGTVRVSCLAASTLSPVQLPKGCIEISKPSMLPTLAYCVRILLRNLTAACE